MQTFKARTVFIARTMTQLEYEAAQAVNATNSNSANGNTVNGALETAKNAMEAAPSAVTSAKDGTFNATAFVTNNAKTVRNLAIIAGIAVIGYYALNIVATTKSNIKTIKA
ncbi:MAG: hypothetical protein LBP54_04220 [Campylobacteraceae bacterium]|nr:hypothetical protein [Campylobacteraceae bacterium]